MTEPEASSLASFPQDDIGLDLQKLFNMRFAQ